MVNTRTGNPGNEHKNKQSTKVRSGDLKNEPAIHKDGTPRVVGGEAQNFIPHFIHNVVGIFVLYTDALRLCASVYIYHSASYNIDSFGKPRERVNFAWNPRPNNRHDKR